MLIYAISSLWSQENVSPPQPENEEKHKERHIKQREKKTFGTKWSKRRLSNLNIFFVYYRSLLSGIKADRKQDRIH